MICLIDSEQFLSRAQNSLKETNGFLVNYQNSVRFDQTVQPYYRLDHRLDVIIHKLQKIQSEFDYMLNPR